MLSLLNMFALNKVKISCAGGWGHLAVLVTALSVLSGPTGAADGGEAALPADVVISVLDELRVWRDEHDRLFAFDKYALGRI